MNSPCHWIEFNIFVLIAVALDLGVFHRRPHKIGIWEALLWSGIGLERRRCLQPACITFTARNRQLEFSTGYLIEEIVERGQSVPVSGLFRTFGVPAEFQHRVLAWGILGALIMRGLLIAAARRWLRDSRGSCTCLVRF